MWTTRPAPFSEFFSGITETADVTLSVPGTQLRGTDSFHSFVTSAGHHGYFPSGLILWLLAPANEMGQSDGIAPVIRKYVACGGVTGVPLLLDQQRT